MVRVIQGDEPDDEIVRMIDKVLSTNDYEQSREFMDALLPQKLPDERPD